MRKKKLRKLVKKDVLLISGTEFTLSQAGQIAKEIGSKYAIYCPQGTKNCLKFMNPHQFDKLLRLRNIK